MPFIYDKNKAADAPAGSGDDTRPGRPSEGGFAKFKSKGHSTAYKIPKAAIKEISSTYNAHTTKDLLEALKLEQKKLPGNRLSSLQVEDAFEITEVIGTAAFDKSKEGVAGIKKEKH